MSFLSALKCELQMIRSDIAVVLTILGGVILYAFLYPQPYSKQSVSNLNASVVDYDHSDISRDLSFAIDATPQINVVRHDMSEEDAKKAVQSAKVSAVIIIPPHFKRDLMLHRNPTVSIGADSSYFLIYGSVLEGVMRSVLTYSATVKIVDLLKKNIPISHAKKAYTPFTLNTVNLFNPNNSYTQYVVPAVFVLILQQTLLIGLGILGGGINERIKRGQADRYLIETPVSTMFAARFLIFGFIFFIHMLFYFGFSFEHFGITHLASIKDLLSFGAAFLFASISLGLFLGVLFNNREIATPAVLFSSLPLVFSVGFVWPIEEIPSWIHYISMIFPSTPAIDGFLSLNQLGAGFAAVVEDFTLLWIQGAVYLLLSMAIFAYKRDNVVSLKSD